MPHPGQAGPSTSFLARLPRIAAYRCTPFFRYVLEAFDTAALAKFRLAESTLRQLRVTLANCMVCTNLGVGHES